MALDEVARENLRRELRPASPSNASITVETRVSNLLPSGDDDSYVRGGGTLSTCTAGFTVRHRVTEELGVATAHHCADSAQRLYSNHSVDGGSALVNRKVRGNTNYGDVAWYDDGAFVASLQFYYNWNAKRYVTAVWSPRTGVDACKFGKTTGVTCDTTYKLNTTRGSYKGLVATHRDKADGGDSGGPWYWGSTAYGIHSGYAYIAPFTRDQFTPASNLPSAMNVEVRR